MRCTAIAVTAKARQLYNRCAQNYVGNKELNLFDEPVKIWKVPYYRVSFCPLSLVTYCFRNRCSHIPECFILLKASKYT